NIECCEEGAVVLVISSQSEDKNIEFHLRGRAVGVCPLLRSTKVISAAAFLSQGSSEKNTGLPFQRFPSFSTAP
ncbi:hypothetical protein F7725_015404, partial [Dissostichus mawsoni]